MLRSRFLLFFVVLSLSLVFLAASDHKIQNSLTPHRLEILFLGHTTNRHHNSERLADIFLKEYFKDGINITFTSTLDDLNEENLSHYDGLILYANHDTISQSQEKSLIDFVRNGKGFIPLHSGSFCFRNSNELVEIIGGQFKSHKYDSFPSVILEPSHPVMKGISPFVATDETYVHHKFSKNIKVLTERVEGDHHEPYTWVKEYGKGRVFYTAYGHDENTFTNQGFLDLVRNGIFWAVGEHAQADLMELKIAKPTYFDGMVPNYERRSPIPKVQSALTPNESMSLMQIPVGFELQLFAAEPDVINPIYINWDERGRLWVIETVDYPNEVKNDDIGDDRIKILEDTDGDGKADKSTIFADHLNIPTSFVFTKGGIILSQSPSFLFLKDTTGDDKADIRKEILPGWGKNDTHAQASNLRYGLDNKIWGVVGYSGFNNKKKGKDSLAFGNGVYRFSPDGKKLEHISTTSNNTWGLGFSEEFDVFISTANNTHTAFLGIHKRFFDKVKINESGVVKLDAHYAMHVATKNLRQVDVHGGFTAAAGHSLYTARSFPKEYWNRIAFVTEPTGRLIHKNILQPSGSGFKEKGDGWNMLVSADEWAAPIQAEVGPDGALWITDWYDFIIQHNPTPTLNSSGINAQNGIGNAYINPLRDHERGRIYRLAYKKNDQQNTIDLSNKNAASLIQALSNDNMFWRTTAQRLLVEKGDKSILPELYKLAGNTQVDETGINAPAIHALWTLHGLNVMNTNYPIAISTAIKALNHKAAGVRKAAIEVLPKTYATFLAMQKTNVFQDKDLRVRLAAILATADMPPSSSIGALLVDMAEKEENISDNWIKHALTITSKLNQETFKLAFKNKGLNSNPSLLEASLAQRLAFGDRLSSTTLRRTSRDQALHADIENREFLISGDIERGANSVLANANIVPTPFSGMVIAHGNKTNGYTVYMMENKLYFHVNIDGKPFQLSSTESLPNKFSFKAGMQKDGTIKLVIDTKEAGVLKAPGLIQKSLEVPIRVGLDTRKGDDKVADYPDTLFFLRANLTNSKLETLESVLRTQELTKPDKVIVLGVLRDVMKYDKTILTAKAGTVLQIILKNPDHMQHNFVLIKPNTSEKVGLEADKLAQSQSEQTAQNTRLQYVPKIPEVLYATPLINPGKSYTLTFKVPAIPGDYPYLCTFPGHWRIMNGILQVTK